MVHGMPLWVLPRIKGVGLVGLVFWVALHLGVFTRVISRSIHVFMCMLIKIQGQN